MWVKKQQLEPDMEQQTGSKLGKEYVKAVYCHPAYLTYMQSTSCEMLGWMKHKLESREFSRRNINNFRYTDEPTLMSESEEELKSVLMKVKEESEKAGLKFNLQKMKIMAFGPITSWQTDGGKWKQWQTLFSWAPKSMQMVTVAMKWKDACSFKEKLWPT